MVSEGLVEVNKHKLYKAQINTNLNYKLPHINWTRKICRCHVEEKKTKWGEWSPILTLLFLFDVAFSYHIVIINLIEFTLFVDTF